MAGLVRDLGREAFWRGVLQRFSVSGLSVRAFCRGESLTVASFYAWRRTIGQRDAKHVLPAPSRPTSALSQPPAFVPAWVTGESRRESGMAIELAGGRVLRLPESMSAQRVAELVLALEATCVAARTER